MQKDHHARNLRGALMCDMPGEIGVRARFRDVPLLREPVDRENLGALLRSYLHESPDRALV